MWWEIKILTKYLIHFTCNIIDSSIFLDFDQQPLQLVFVNRESETYIGD